MNNGIRKEFLESDIKLGRVSHDRGFSHGYLDISDTNSPESRCLTKMICDCLSTDLPHWSPIYFFNNDKRKKACVVIYLLYKLGCCMCNNFFLCQQLWESGFSLSYSKASGVLNGDKINRTIYYILSNVPAPMHDASTSKRERNAIEKVLYFPDRCYQGHSTLWVKQKQVFLLLS